jgi:hypothetical protein
MDESIVSQTHVTSTCYGRTDKETDNEFVQLMMQK